MVPAPVATPETREGVAALIGGTPLVRLRHVVHGVVPDTVEIWAKLEWFNPGGSVKDRAARAMIEAAERGARLPPGTEFLDASSGNTGIALGMLIAARGYRLTLCLPANANAERKAALRAYGVCIVETDPLEGSDGAILRARAMTNAEPGRFVYLDQYNNDANWRAHVDTTGPEIWRDTGGRVTHFVATLGTTGTFTGTSRYLKAQRPGVRCLAVQPDSPFHGLEGLKYLDTSIVPGIYDSTVPDAHIAAPTEASLSLVRRLATEEGLLAGISSGAALWGAIQTAQTLDHGVLVTIFPDGGARYLSEHHVFAPEP